MDVFGRKFRRLCSHLESCGFVKLETIGILMDVEYHHQDGRILHVGRGMFPNIY